MNIFEDFDFEDFWSDDEFTPFTEKELEETEKALGYKLPKSYIDLMRIHNGGGLEKDCFPTTEKSSWAEDHECIYTIMGIGNKNDDYLCGESGSLFWVEEWGYPNIGVYFGDTPTAGHTMIALDYRKCGKDGEPEVVSVDQEADYNINFLAKDFETFIRGLVSEDEFDTSEQDKQDSLEMTETGQFSDVLTDLCAKVPEKFNIENKIRILAKSKVEEFGSFSLHADDFSMMLYDIQFWLYSYPNESVDKNEYLITDYTKIITFGTFTGSDENHNFTCGGYAPNFVSDDWLETRIKEGRIIESDNEIKMSPSWIKELEESILNISV